MGVFRNAVKRKTHKERAQPLARKKFGLLEKKKDARLRSKDYHKKEDALRILRQKAEAKNPDEFYFGMENAVTKNGIHSKPTAEANKYTQEELRLMKTQDIKYISLKAQTEAKKIAQLQQRLHLVGAPTVSQHISFVEEDTGSESSDESADELSEAPVPKGGIPENGEAAVQTADASDHSSDEGEEDQLRSAEIRPEFQAKLDKYKANAYNELAERLQRHQKLVKMTEEMQLRKELMGKGGSRKIQARDPAAKPVYKWNLVRKR